MKLLRMQIDKDLFSLKQFFSSLPQMSPREFLRIPRTLKDTIKHQCIYRYQNNNNKKTQQHQES